MKNNRLALGAMLLASSMTISAQKPITAPQGGKQISDELLGIFFEDISYATDGGLNANLVQNGSFEYNPSVRDEWGPGTAWKFQRPGHSAGYINFGTQNPLHSNNPTYMRIYAERIGHYYDYDGWTGVGMLNNGFNGMNVKAGAKYDFSVFMRNVSGKGKPVRIVLTAPGMKPKVLAETILNVYDKEWQKYVATLEVAEDCKNASLQILMLEIGEMDVDMVSLVPQDTYHGHGIRKDLAEALEGLNPKFMRFPGGCVAHGGGDGFWDTYRWKTTVGPKETRKAIKNTWGYNQSMEVGYFEYFQLCEDMGMEPLPILPCGVSCQGVNGGWGMRTQAQEVKPMDEMDEWVQDALDLIEWANGPVTSKWGAVRAAAGHPEPFNLKYLGIGNEEKITPEFSERFKYIYNKVMERYPGIIVVGTAGPGSHPGNPDYENSWKLAEEIGLPIIDEHYYDSRQQFIDSRQYDNEFYKDKKCKVYLGEYSVQDRSHGQMNQWGDALAEAIYLMHVERNADKVVMTSYAPLFAYRHNTNWNPDMIYFDNERPFFTCSYYVQQMFGQSAGQYFYGDCVKFADGDDEFKNHLLGQSVVLNVKDRKLFVKVANMTDNATKATVDLGRFSVKPNAVKTTLSGALDAENNYDKHPVEPAKEDIKVNKKMNVDIPAHTLIMYTINL